MKRSSNDAPFLSWCLIVRNCERTLEACLRSLRARTPEAEIVVVDTCSSDDTVAIAKRYADVFDAWAGPRGNWNAEMFAFDDAAAARQHSFELAHGRWRAWIDADDVLPAPAEAERLLKLNNRWQVVQQQATVDRGPEDGAPEALEDMLRRLESVHPRATCVWAPYLYQRDEDDCAIVWQDRERIVRWNDPPKYRWCEEAHEILTPAPGYTPVRVDFAHLLFVHEKKFTEDDYLYNLKRHFSILLTHYEVSERTNRRCLYLANQAKFICPEREREFLDAASDTAYTTLDRYRTLIALGGYWADRGLYYDAVACFGAATTLHPELPDAWLSAGEVAVKFRDFAHAVKCFDQGLTLNVNNPASFVNPRHHVVRYPTMLVNALRESAKTQVSVGLHTLALQTLNHAVTISKGVYEHPAIGNDRNEAKLRLNEVTNEAHAQKHAIELRGLFAYLLANDESERATKVLDVVPHNLHEHPLIVECTCEAEGIVDHLEDPAVYQEFYNSKCGTGYIRSDEAWFDPRTADGGAGPRPHWIAAWLEQRKPDAHILEIGCHDGLTGIPVIRELKHATYHGVDINREAIEWLQENIKKYALTDRATCEVVAPSTDLVEHLGRQYDAIIWCEVIEHVANPYEELNRIAWLLKPDGLLFVSTPWGALDHGQPPANTYYGTPRGNCGHVRALTAREVTDMLSNTGLDTVDLYRSDCVAGPQYTMHAIAKLTPATFTTPVQFVVPGALWNWNGRSVRTEGIGASEETIVYLAEKLTAKRRVDVYGPTEHPDTCLSVKYWPKTQARHIREFDSAKIVVSRSPATGLALEQDKHLQDRTRYPKILWLQDAYYSDLNRKVAECYEKIVVVSEWHKRVMHEEHGVPLDKMEVIYNFLLPEHFVRRPPRRPHHFIYASSPDRGLNRLLRMWPRILARWPDATLSTFYGWRGCSVLAAGNSDWAQRFTSLRREYETLRHQKGVLEHEMVSHERIAQELMQASVWLYPTSFTETCCTLALKARVAGCIPVTTALAALEETAACPQGRLLPVDADDTAFIDAVAEIIDTSELARGQMAIEAIEKYNIHRALEAWERLL